MHLRHLAAGFQIVPPGADPDITSITEDSRRVEPGRLFVAVTGTRLDGHAYVADAIARGAAAVVVERPGSVPDGTPRVQVSSSRTALADLAARFYQRPGDDLAMIGFTGTFGKTSTSEILRALLDAGGAQTGVLGSLGARYRQFREPSTGLTTPAPIELHRSLRRLRDAGATTVILEVTSHALRLGRVHGLTFDGGLLAAIMPGEHTDFHRSYDEYVGAKRLFLSYLSPDAVLAYDADNRASRQLASEATVARRSGFSLEGRDADLQFFDVLVDARGATFSVAGNAVQGATGERLHSTLLGRGHLRNVALALAYAFAAGVNVSTARDVLARLRPLRRRMERYTIDGRTVLDDTAGHPDSFSAAFEVAAMLPRQDLVVVYALRGNRGTDINRQNARALGDLVALHGATTFVVTAAIDSDGEKDRATAAEIEATRQTLVARGIRFVWHDELRRAIQEAATRSKPGDLLLLIGAQSMDRGRELLGGEASRHRDLRDLGD